MLEFESQIGFNLHRVHTLFRRELIKCLRDYDLNPEQWEVMVILWQRKKISQKKINEITLQDLPSISRMIKRMEKKKLIQIRRSEEDRRTTLITLTEYGLSLEEALAGRVSTHFDAILNQLSDDSKNSFMNILKKFRNILADTLPATE